MSTDFPSPRVLHRTDDMLQCNICAVKIGIDGHPGMELGIARQSGFFVPSDPGTAVNAVLNDGDKIQFARSEYAVQDYVAEAEKLGVRSLF